MTEPNKEPQSGYRGLATYYADLFPVSQPLADFLLSFVESCRESGHPWLDVGCGTGALVHWLLDQGVNAFGVDPDRDFIEEAKRQSAEREGHFAIGGMNDFGSFAHRDFGVITCLGNVLAQAEDIHQIDRFIQRTSRSLIPDGNLIVQTVNYDRVLMNEDFTFPVLERTASDGEALGFHRKYSWHGDRLLFETRLEVGHQIFENQSLLLPLKVEALDSLVRNHFVGTEKWGDFEKHSWTSDSPATIFLCRK
ncbi:MAG: class I SAM-dependent methyltransferase [Candidatus Omnitrophica bacterium]|nr:class I SAM-dependent methyltransferase [Candidatus Omnitrophota bacterium]